MVAKTEEVVSNKLDSFKLLLAIAILVLGVVGFYYYEAESQLYRVLGVVFAAIVAIAISSTTTLGQNLIGFGREARMEVRKVVWPTRQETLQTTFMVIVAVIVIGIFLWLLDIKIRKIYREIYTSGEKLEEGYDGYFKSLRKIGASYQKEEKSKDGDNVSHKKRGVSHSEVLTVVYWSSFIGMLLLSCLIKIKYT